MDRAINAPVHGNNAVDGFNATYKRSLKGQMELIGKLASNETSKIGLIQISSKDISIKIVDQFIHILNNKEKLKGLKVSTKRKINHYYSNINSIYIVFKVTLMLTT